MNDKERYSICCNESKDLKWHLRFLALADHISSWSKDPSTHAGAVIVDRKQRVVSVGYNGFPRGVLDTEERLNNRPLKYDFTVHAETNSILFAQRNLEGCTIYVSPLGPCVKCAIEIIQSGITMVVFPTLAESLVERWGESIEKSKLLFSESGVEFIEVKKNENN